MGGGGDMVVYGCQGQGYAGYILIVLLWLLGLTINQAYRAPIA